MANTSSLIPGRKDAADPVLSPAARRYADAFTDALLTPTRSARMEAFLDRLTAVALEDDVRPASHRDASQNVVNRLPMHYHKES